MTEGLVYDSLGVPLNDGDILIYKDMAFRIRKISVAERPQILNPALRNPEPQIPRIVGIRVVADITLTCEMAKRLRDAYKAAAVPETQIPDKETKPS